MTYHKCSGSSVKAASAAEKGLRYTFLRESLVMQGDGMTCLRLRVAKGAILGGVHAESDGGQRSGRISVRVSEHLTHGGMLQNAHVANGVMSGQFEVDEESEMGNDGDVGGGVARNDVCDRCASGVW